MIAIFNMFIVGCKITKNVVSLTQKKMEKQFQLYAAPLQGLTEPAWRNAHWQTIGGVDAYFTPFVRWERGGVFVTRTGVMWPRRPTVSIG